MPSRAETRGGIELALRAVSLGLLAWIFWLSLDRGRPESKVSAGSASLAASLHEWSRRGIAPDNVVAQLDSNPSPVERDWLRSLRGAGSVVSWSGNLPPVAVSAQPVASPRGGLRILAAAPAGTQISLSDEVGTLDTAIARQGGAAFSIASASGKISARAGAATARATIPDSVNVKRVMVIGSAGWETKFVVAALEEDGWKVDADIRVAPSVDVTQGSTSGLDTARYSAVIALDNSAAARAPEIIRFASNGGGVVLAGSAASNEGFSAIRAGASGKSEGLALESEPGTVSLASLSYAPVAGMRGDAIPLDRRGSSVTVAARRYLSGRVIQSGYLDTWRWRMSGGDESPQAHRAWWTSTVANVAYAPRSDSAYVASDNAPIASLVAALGPAASTSHANLGPKTATMPLWWLFALLSLSLLGEWASRRLRGSR
jgi:hypothetical protein